MRLDELDSCLAALGELDTSCQARLGDPAPRFDVLRTSLQTVKATLEPLVGSAAEAFEPEVEAQEEAGCAAADIAVSAFHPDQEVPSQSISSELPLDRVHFTITAPSAIYPASSVVVTLWVHLESQRAAVMDPACQQNRAHDPASIMSVSKGPVRIALGVIISVRIEGTGTRIEDPEDPVLWDGEIGCANFVVVRPNNPRKKTLRGKAVVYLNGVQLAKVQFMLQVGTAPADARIPITADIFFDVLTLRSGQSWGGEIEKLIAASDVFYLFWSLNARSSDWVERAWRTALGTGRPDFIDPVPSSLPKRRHRQPSLRVSISTTGFLPSKGASDTRVRLNDSRPRRSRGMRNEIRFLRSRAPRLR